jgi:hypothetical protein
MKEYRIRVEHFLNGKVKTGTIKCKDLKRVMEILASYGFIINRVVTLS